jgi:hypothetical protein
MHKRLLYHALKAESEELARQLDRICEAAYEIWESQHLREFTVHGGPHFTQVEANLDSLTHNLQASPKHLTPEEIFVLVAACYLHDIGMQLGVGDAREKHAQYAYELVLHSSAQIGPEERRVTLPIKDSNARAAVARIARAHWTEFALQLPEEDYIYANERGRARLLGLLLANADLLDTSAIRAGYFRSDHRLFDLNPVSELHQTMHHLVTGYEIKPADPNVPHTLLFELQWRDHSTMVQDMSEWQLRWFSSQLRQIMHEVERLSGGALRWATPWARVVFRPAEGPMPELSIGAKRVLAAELAAQRRIDRDKFAGEFRQAIGQCSRKVFQLSASSNSDARQMAEWCQAHAMNAEGCIVARIDLASSDPMEIASLVANLFEQYGEHLPECDDGKALEKLKDYVLRNREASFVLLAVADSSLNDVLRPILESILFADIGKGLASRVCIVICPTEIALSEADHVERRSVDLSSFDRSEVDEYLRRRYGFNPDDAGVTVGNMDRIGLLAMPSRVYTYIEDHCDRTLWENCFV